MKEKAYFYAKNLIQKFDSMEVNASFECEKASMTSIVGSSGSGKSTLLRLICGLNKADPKQELFLDGIDINKLPPSRRQTGLVFQSNCLFNHLTVEDNVAYGLISNGVKRKDARKEARDFLKYFELEGFEKRYPETLSGGEAQRVSLARTLIMKPKLVLFDEPLSALDAPLRKKLALLIKKLQKDFGFTGIMVTHDISEAKSMSDQIILLEKGQIIWQGLAEAFREELLPSH